MEGLTAAEFVKRHWITIKIKDIDERPDNLMDDMPAGSRHYKITIKSGLHKGKVKVFCSYGPACSTPEAIDVIGSCAMDCCTVICHDGPESLCSDFDYEYKQSLHVWEAVTKSYRKFEQFFDADTFEEFLQIEW